MAAITHRPIGRMTTKNLAVSAVIILGSIYIIINVLLITREYGVEPSPPMIQFYSDTSAVSFCGDGFWSNTEIRCNDRVQYLHETYATTVDEAISSLLKKDECVCNQTGETKHSIHNDVAKMQVPHQMSLSARELVQDEKKSPSPTIFEWKCQHTCSCLPNFEQVMKSDDVVIMHQSYKSANPETWHWGWKSQRQTWIDLHPNWVFIFWNDVQNALLANCTGFGDVFVGRSGIQQADLSRLLYLHSYGGFYSDMDYIALRNHQHLFNLDDQRQIKAQQILLQGREDQVVGFEWGYARYRQHPLWESCLRIARQQKGKTKRQGCPIWFTGPKFLNRCIKKFFGQQNKELHHMISYGKNDLMILDPKLVAPIRGDDFSSDCGKWRNVTAGKDHNDNANDERIWTEVWPKSSCVHYLNDSGTYAVTLYSHSWGTGLKC